jgi:hypothetical protein
VGTCVKSRDVIFGCFAGVNKDRLPFSYVPNEHNFVHFLRLDDMFPLKMQYNLIIWVDWNRDILSMGLCLIDVNILLNRAVIFVLIQLPVLCALQKQKRKRKIWWRVRYRYRIRTGAKPPYCVTIVDDVARLEYGSLTILSHIVLAKFARTSREIGLISRHFGVRTTTIWPS